MPTLPTLTVSQAHFDRIVQAFPGDTAAEKSAAYQAWLTGHLIDYVEQQEVARLREQANAQLMTQLEAVRASLPARPAFPPGADTPAP